MKYPRLYAPSANSSTLRLIPARLEQQIDVPQYEMRLESTLAEVGVVPKLYRPQVWMCISQDDLIWFWISS